MKWLDFRLVPANDVTPPADLDARMANPHVAALAANIKALGEQSQNAPVVQDGTNEIISGRDRYAAYLINGATELWVHVADATEAERADMEESENLFRRPVQNRDELLARRSAKLADALIVTDVTIKEAKAAARKQTAIEAGTTPAAVKQAEYRQSSKSQEKTARRPAPSHGEQLSGETGAETAVTGNADGGSAPVEPAIDMMGETATDEWLTVMAVIVAIVEGVDHELRQLQAACKALPQPLQQRLRDALHTAGAAARALRPEIVCAVCRDPDGTKGARKDCQVCAGNGWLSKEAKGGMHPETLAHPVVAKKATVRVAPSSIRHARNTILIETPDGDVPFVDVPDPTDDDAPEEGDAF